MDLASLNSEVEKEKNSLIKVIGFTFPSTYEELTRENYIGTQYRKLEYLGFRIPPKEEFDPRIFQEDSYNRSLRYPIFATADGITWKGRGGENFPFPSPPKECADIFTRIFVEEGEKIYKKIDPQNYEELIRSIFNKANEEIRKFNENRLRGQEINYWDVDFAHISASGIFINGNYLYYGVIGECGVRVYRKGEKIFETKPINWAHKDESSIGYQIFQEELKKLEEEIQKLQSFGGFSVRDRERLGRKYFRNKVLRKEENGKEIIIPYGYGVLSGEEDALYFLDIGIIPLELGDLIVVYSDGFVPVLESDLWVEFLKNNDEKKLKDSLSNSRHIFSKEMTAFIIQYQS